MIFFIYGADTFSAANKIKDIRDKFLREVDATGSSVSRLSGESAGLNEINNALSSNSLFARRRLVVLENFFLQSDKAAFDKGVALFRKKLAGSDNAIVFYEPAVILHPKRKEPLILTNGKEKKLLKTQKEFYNWLLQQDYSQHYGLPTDKEKALWLQQELKQAKLRITYPARELLLALAGETMWSLKNETDKLIHYKQAGGDDTIKEDDVKEMVRGSLDQTIFTLTDAVSNKNKKKAMSLLLEQSRAGLSDFYLLSMLIRQFRILLSIRDCLDSGLSQREMQSSLKQHPYVLQKGINQARNFSAANLKHIYQSLLRLDYNQKTGTLPVQTMVDLLVARL